MAVGERDVRSGAQPGAGDAGVAASDEVGDAAAPVPVDGPTGDVLTDPAVLVGEAVGLCGRFFGVFDEAAYLVAKVPELEWGRLDAAGLRSAAVGLQRLISALEHQQRAVLAAIDARGAFAADGSRDASDWAANNLGVSRQRANDQVRLGRELGELPNLAEKAAAGELSTDQAKPTVLLAEPVTDRQWAGQAPELPVSVLQRQASKRRRPSAADARAAHAGRHFRVWFDQHEMRFRGSLPVDEGQRLLTAVEREMPPHRASQGGVGGSGDGVELTPDQRRADGLAGLARARLAADADPDRATVVLVTELAAVTDEDPEATAELELGQPLATEAARRLICDSRLQVVVQDRDGVAVGVGTTARVVTPAMRRALMRRDGRCRMGNCSNTRFLHAHHVVPWPSPTCQGNLVLLCPYHHHLVHEGGWVLSGDPNGTLLATSPDGRVVLRSRPLAMRVGKGADRTFGRGEGPSLDLGLDVDPDLEADVEAEAVTLDRGANAGPGDAPGPAPPVGRPCGGGGGGGAGAGPPDAPAGPAAATPSDTGDPSGPSAPTNPSLFDDSG